MWTTIFLTLLAAGGLSVDARLLDGSRVEGRLTALDAEKAVLETTQGHRSVPLDELVSVTRAAEPRAAASPPIAVELLDGSTIVADQLLIHARRAELIGPFGSVAFRVDDIRSARFVQAGPPLLKQWTRLLGEQTDSDLLVVSSGDSLNYHRGILRDVDADRVGFESDGQVLRVNRSKVFGLVYYHPAGRVLPGAVATLADTFGSRWTVRTISLADGVFKVTTPVGAAFDCPVDRLSSLDFSQGKIVFLGQLKPLAVRWTPYYELKEELPSRKAYFAPVHDPGEAGPLLMLDGKRYSRGVALCSRTELEYELPEGYRRFQAVCGIDDAMRRGGSARLVISADGRPLVERTVVGTEPARPIDLDVAGVRRLTILVDFGENGDAGDHVDLCEARIIK